MAVQINQVNRGPKKDALDKIAQGLDIANGVLGIGLAIPKYIQDRNQAKAELAQTQAKTKELEADAQPLTAEESSQISNQLGLPPTLAPKTIGQAKGMLSRVIVNPVQQGQLKISQEELNIKKLAEKRAQDEAARKAKLESLTPGEKASDEAFGRDYQDFNAQGGYATAQNNLKTARWAVKELMDAHKNRKNYSGKDVGLLSGKARAFTYPDAANLEERVSQVVIGGLRQALGPQFTQAEGERILSQTFNPLLDEEVNAKRLNSLIDRLDKQLRAKRDAGDYFSNNGTLKGWKGSFIQNFDPEPLSTEAEDY